MSGKMLFVSIALLVMLFFVETASAQVNVATLEQLQAALAGSDETITVTQTIVIDEDLTLDGGGKTVKLDSNARIRLINSATFEHITIDGGELQRSYPLVVVEGNGGITLTLGDGVIIQNARTSGNGGAIELYGAKLQMNDGRILNCTAQNGGGIYLGSESVVQMDGGIISGCKADENGGAVFSLVLVFTSFLRCPLVLTIIIFQIFLNHIFLVHAILIQNLINLFIIRIRQIII